VHVFLFRSDGTLCIQQRAPDKDIQPGRWDLTVGEHLQPGEDYAAAAHRGLREELGIAGVELTPLGAERPFRCDLPERGIADHELQAAFRGVFDGALEPDGVEVAAVRSIGAAELHAWIARAPGDFTPWFLHELRTRPGLGAFGLGGTAAEEGC
jgi:isopentenyldiphosphate isomerase